MISLKKLCVYSLFDSFAKKEQDKYEDWAESVIQFHIDGFVKEINKHNIPAELKECISQIISKDNENFTFKVWFASDRSKYMFEWSNEWDYSSVDDDSNCYKNFSDVQEKWVDFYIMDEGDNLLLFFENKLDGAIFEYVKWFATSSKFCELQGVIANIGAYKRYLERSFNTNLIERNRYKLEILDEWNHITKFGLDVVPEKHQEYVMQLRRKIFCE